MLNHTRYSLTAVLILGFVPAVLAGILTRNEPQPRSIAGVAERSKLVFSQYAVHLGEVRPIGTIPAHFDFVNRGDSPIQILKLEPSCGCLAPRLYEDKKVYAPGEHGRFYVSVKTANETPGPKDYTVKVTYNDGEPQERTVSFHLTVPERKVSVTPAEVYFYQTQGKPDFREIVVEDHRGQNLNVLGVVSSTEYAQIQVGQKIVEGRISRTPIRIDVPADVPLGKSTALLTIQTDDPDYEIIRVPILIWGPSSKIQQTSGEEISPETPQQYPAQ